jgi:Icc protein
MVQSPPEAMLFAQLTDPHIVERGRLFNGRIDSAERLVEALVTLESFEPRPEVILATGDLVNDGTSEQYDHLAEILERSTIPIYPVPGNHDDRQLLRSLFSSVLPDGRPTDPIDYVIEDHRLRLIGLDTTVPGEPGGNLTAQQLSWLDDRLAEQPIRPTVIFQHHPPFATGIGWMDEMGLDNTDDEAAVIERHPQVVAVLAGHIHRPISTGFAKTLAICAPSTAAQLAPALDGGWAEYSDEPGAVLVHRYAGMGLVAHFLPVPPPRRWTPSWARGDRTSDN